MLDFLVFIWVWWLLMGFITLLKEYRYVKADEGSSVLHYVFIFILVIAAWPAIVATVENPKDD